MTTVLHLERQRGSGGKAAGGAVLRCPAIFLVGTICQDTGRRGGRLTGRKCAGYMTKITDSKVYVPPETLFAHSVNAHSVSVDAAVDVWALGVLMLECFSGTPTAAAYAPVTTFVPGAGTATVAGGTGSIASAASGPVEDNAARLTRALFDRLESVSLPRIYGAPVTADIATELRALRLKMAGCLAREPVRRPGIKQLVQTLQKTRDALQAASAANVWMPSDDAKQQPPRPRSNTPPPPQAPPPQAAPPAEATPPAEPGAAPLAALPPQEDAAEAAAAPSAAAQPRRSTGDEAAAELRGKLLTGMLDSDARVAKCEAWVTSMHDVTQDRPPMTVTVTDDSALDSPPRRATASMFEADAPAAAGTAAPHLRGSGGAGARVPQARGSSAGGSAVAAERAAGGARRAEDPPRPSFTPMGPLADADVQTREVTPLVTSPLELKADSTLDSELAGRH